MRDLFVSAVIAAAGSSSRMNSEVPKVFLPLCGKPVLSYSLETFGGCGRIGEIILVVRGEDLERAEKLCESIEKFVPHSGLLGSLTGKNEKQFHRKLSS